MVVSEIFGWEVIDFELFVGFSELYYVWSGKDFW